MCSTESLYFQDIWFFQKKTVLVNKTKVKLQCNIQAFQIVFILRRKQNTKPFISHHR